MLPTSSHDFLCLDHQLVEFAGVDERQISYIDHLLICVLADLSAALVTKKAVWCGAAQMLLPSTMLSMQQQDLAKVRSKSGPVCFVRSLSPRSR